MFSSLVVVGSSLFALGSMFPGSPALLPLMLTGRLLFGAGYGSLASMSHIFYLFHLYGMWDQTAWMVCGIK